MQGQGDSTVIDTPDGYRYHLRPFTGRAGINTALAVARILSSLLDGKALGVSKETTPAELLSKVIDSTAFDRVAKHLTLDTAEPLIEHLASCSTYQTPEILASAPTAKMPMDDWSEHFRGRLGALRVWLVEGMRWQLGDFIASWQDPGPESGANNRPASQNGPKN